MTKLKLVQLHEPLFLSGTNFGQKLEPKTNKGMLELLHDPQSDHVIVKYKGEEAHIKNWASFNIDNNQVTEVKQIHHEQTMGSAVKAQIGGPKDVFTAQVSTPISEPPKKVIRRAKYQGEEGTTE